MSARYLFHFIPTNALYLAGLVGQRGHQFLIFVSKITGTGNLAKWI